MMKKIATGLFVGPVRLVTYQHRKYARSMVHTTRKMHCAVLQPQLEQHSLAVEMWGKITQEQFPNS